MSEAVCQHSREDTEASFCTTSSLAALRLHRRLEVESLGSLSAWVSFEEEPLNLSFLAFYKVFSLCSDSLSSGMGR